MPEMLFLLIFFSFIQVAENRCDAGRYLSYGNCFPCREGYYQDKPNQTSCKMCPTGYYNTNQGATESKICPLGHSCYFVDRLPSPCKEGYYQDQPGQRKCKMCQRGYYNKQLAATKCNICPVGHSCYYVDNYPSPCNIGYYQDQMGQRKCKMCEDGYYNKDLGATKCNICPVGHSCYYVDNYTSLCKKGYYQDQKGQRKCKLCPAGRSCFYADRIPFICPKGTYAPQGSIDCFNCPKNGYCPTTDMLPFTRIQNDKLSNAISYSIRMAGNAYKNLNTTKNNLPLTDSDKNVHGYVSYADDKIIVAFRGSHNLNDWIQNIKFFKTNYSKCSQCEVHTGFLNSYNSVRLQMLSKVSFLRHAHPNGKIVVTGHSLGGAQATLAAIDLSKSRHNIDLVTLGSPRVGNERFKEYANKTIKGSNLRVTYRKDVVTVSPPQLIGFWHVGTEIHFEDSNSMFELPKDQDLNHNRVSVGDHSIDNYEKLFS